MWMFLIAVAAGGATWDVGSNSVILESPGAVAGWGSVLAVADVNADSYDDFLVGDPGGGAPSSDAGIALFLGPLVPGVTEADAIYTIDGPFDDSGTASPISIDISQDFDGDGENDLVLGTPGLDYGTASGGGTVFVVFGPLVGTCSDITTCADVIIAGNTAGDGLGPVAAGDFDSTYPGPELAVGAPGSGTEEVVVFTAATLAAGGVLDDSDATYDFSSTHANEGRALATIHLASGVDRLAIGAVGAVLVQAVDLDDADGNLDTQADWLHLDGSLFGDGFGSSLAAGLADPVETTLPALLVGSNEVDGAGDAWYLYYRVNRNGELASADATFQSVTSEDAARSVSMGDVNGDGLDDLLLGDSSAEFGSGSAYVYYAGSSRLSGAFTPDSDADELLQCFGTSCTGGRPALGTSVAAGDINGDGRDDVLVGEPGDETSHEGRVYVVHARLQSLEDGPLDAADAIFEGVSALDQAGFSVAHVGDVNCDGYDDFAIGAVFADSRGASGTKRPSRDPFVGKVYVFFGPAPGDSGTLWTHARESVAGADAIILGPDSNSNFGYSIAGVGDVDGGGCGDLLIGAPTVDGGNRYSGAAYLYLGESGIDGNMRAGNADAVFAGSEVHGFVGFDVSGIGDFDQDGLDDFVIGAPYDDGVFGAKDTGAAYVYYGSTTAWDGSTYTPSADADCAYHADGTQEHAGWALSGGFDFDGDAVPDFAIGVPHDRATLSSFPPIGVSSGSAYVITEGDCGGTLTNQLLVGKVGFPIYGEGAGDEFGAALAVVYDLGADEYDDLLIGAPEADSDDGRVYLVPGRSSPSGEDAAPGGGVAICPPSAKGHFGASVSSGDVIDELGKRPNGDVRADLVVGAPDASSTGTTTKSPGIVYLIDGHDFEEDFGTTDCLIAGTEIAAVQLWGVNANDDAGWSVSATGDLDGDGESDVVVGAANADPAGKSAGEAYVVLSSYISP